MKKQDDRTANYRAADPKQWTGRIDDPTDPDSHRWHQLMECIDLTDPDVAGKIDGKSAVAGRAPEDQNRFCFLGYCCDRGVEKNLGRSGASKAPVAIRKELANLPRSFGADTRLFDAGDVICFDEDLERAQLILERMVQRILQLGLFPILLGGGHDIAFGHFNGITDFLDETAREYNNACRHKVGIINFDAHFDLRPYAKGPSSGTMFLQIADMCKERQMDFFFFFLGVQHSGNTVSLFKKADELGARYIPAKDITDASMLGVLEKLEPFIRKNDHLYLTICADVFSSAYAPGVSAPQPFGMHPEAVLKLIKHILVSGKVISFDIAEVSPRFDDDNQTAKLAAILIFALINKLSEKDR
ncbi:MAG: formimidoylglutamase [bacterium]|nr:formimidoylglutamase [bacterium]